MKHACALRVCEKIRSCFESLSTNGKSSMLSRKFPFALSLVEGRGVIFSHTLSPSLEEAEAVGKRRDPNITIGLRKLASPRLPSLPRAVMTQAYL